MIALLFLKTIILLLLTRKKCNFKLNIITLKDEQVHYLKRSGKTNLGSLTVALSRQNAIRLLSTYSHRQYDWFWHIGGYSLPCRQDHRDHCFYRFGPAVSAVSKGSLGQNNLELSRYSHRRLVDLYGLARVQVK